MSRVRKLLRLAEDQSDTPEGVAALKRAEAILAEHGLARTDVSLAIGLDFRHREVALGAPTAWRRTLVHAIADYFDCVALYRGGQADQAETYGPEQALPQIDYTYGVYLRQLRLAWTKHTEALQQDGTWGRLSRAQQFDTREAFCVSYVLGVKERLELDRRSEREDDPMAWDVTLKQRKALDRWMRQGGVRWRANPSGVHAFSDEGYRAGLEAEVRAGVGQGSSARRLTGKTST